MKSDREKLEKRLKEAEDARFAKEGEVSILRASMHKVSVYVAPYFMMIHILHRLPNNTPPKSTMMLSHALLP